MSYSIAVFCLLAAAASAAAASPEPADLWLRPGHGTDKPLWGLRGGIQVALWPASIEGTGDGGPRGLLRIGYPMLDGGAHHGLINFVAVEPIVHGRRGFSELEKSATDGRPGRVFWTGPQDAPTPTPDAGALTRDGGAERLTVTVRMERFDNGARPVVVIELRSDRPDEVRLTVHAAPDSAPMDYCVLTATMGNYGRLRRLWLKDGVVEAKSVWPHFEGDEFTPEAFLALDRLPMVHGDVLVCATTDEADPGSVPADPRAPWWRYRGSFPLTQYWRQPRGTWRNDLRLRVNGRRVYWANHTPIPNGLAYENFDMVARYYDGQAFVFGVTRKKPDELLRGAHTAN